MASFSRRIEQLERQILDETNACGEIMSEIRSLKGSYHPIDQPATQHQQRTGGDPDYVSSSSAALHQHQTRSMPNSPAPPFHRPLSLPQFVPHRHQQHQSGGGASASSVPHNGILPLTPTSSVDLQEVPSSSPAHSRIAQYLYERKRAALFESGDVQAFDTLNEVKHIVIDLMTSAMQTAQLRETSAMNQLNTADGEQRSRSHQSALWHYKQQQQQQQANATTTTVCRRQQQQQQQRAMSLGNLAPQNGLSFRPIKIDMNTVNSDGRPMKPPREQQHFSDEDDTTPTQTRPTSRYPIEDRRPSSVAGNVINSSSSGPTTQYNRTDRFAIDRMFMDYIGTQLGRTIAAKRTALCEGCRVGSRERNEHICHRPPSVYIHTHGWELGECTDIADCFKQFRADICQNDDIRISDGRSVNAWFANYTTLGNYIEQNARLIGEYMDHRHRNREYTTATTNRRTLQTITNPFLAD